MHNRDDLADRCAHLALIYSMGDTLSHSARWP